MFKAIGQFFNVMFTLLSAADKGAASIDAIAGNAEAESVGMANQMTIEREARLNALVKQLKAV
jgi:hypothetical protein